MSKVKGKTFYIAASLSNRDRMMRLAENLKGMGMVQTFCWDAVPFEHWPQQAHTEVTAVHDAEIFIALLPGKLGTVTEVGIALGAKVNNPARRVILHAESDELFTKCDFENGKYPAVFWLHPAIERVVGANYITVIRNQILNH